MSYLYLNTTNHKSLLLHRGVNAVSYSGHNSSIYTAGEDGMICQIDFSAGIILGKFKASTKAISALSISAGLNY